MARGTDCVVTVFTCIVLEVVVVEENVVLEVVVEVVEEVVVVVGTDGRLKSVVVSFRWVKMRGR
jgi:hypothetical protein